MYIAVPMLLVFVGEVDPNHPRPLPVVLALVMCLPAIVATFPVLYLGLALLWKITGANDGGAAWPLTIAWLAVVGATALCNVILFDRWREARAVRRTA